MFENMNNNPRFSKTWNNDFQLLSNLPCIDSGNPVYEVPYGGGRGLKWVRMSFIREIIVLHAAIVKSGVG